MSVVGVIKRLVIVATLAVAPIPHAEAQPQTSTELSADNELFVNYYRHPEPERLIGSLERFQQQPNWYAYPSVTGFFAVVFHEHPDWIQRLVPDHLNARSAEAVAAALQLSGQAQSRQSLQPRFDDAGTDANLEREFAGLPVAIGDLRVTRPTHLDILWGAFCASGDQRYVQMIIAFMAKTAERSEQIALDIARTAVALSGGPSETYGQLIDRYGQELGIEIIIAASAGRGLGSNGARHEAVAEAMTTYIAAHPTSYTTKILTVLRSPKAGTHP